MKTQKTILSLAIIISVFILSCKKENVLQPINEISSSGKCTTCPVQYLKVDTIWNGTIYYINKINTNFVQNEKFILRNGTLIDPLQIVKTPFGFYGWTGLLLNFNMANSNFSSIPTELSFTHVRGVGNASSSPNGSLADASLINIKFDNTPLISCTADSVGYYLGPYGYSVQHFTFPSRMYVSQIGYTDSMTMYGNIADSIVISGLPSGLTNVKVGANLMESELRNICFKLN